MNEIEEEGVYETPATAGQQPTIEHSAPAGGGPSSSEPSGGLKRERINSGPTAGHSIAGRDIETNEGIGLAGTAASGSSQAESLSTQSTDTGHGPRTGGPEAGGRGITGFGGTSPSANKDIEPQVDETIKEGTGSTS